APPLAVGPPADPPPDHHVTNGALRRVVRRRHPIDPREGPQALLKPQDLGSASARHPAAAARPLAQCRLDLAPPRLIEIDGVSLPLNGRADRSGISRATIRYRRQSGWSDRDAILSHVGSKRLGA